MGFPCASISKMFLQASCVSSDFDFAKHSATARMPINDLISYTELTVLFFDHQSLTLIKFIPIINLTKDSLSSTGNEILSRNCSETFCFLFSVEYKSYVLMWETVKYNIYNC